MVLNMTMTSKMMTVSAALITSLGSLAFASSVHAADATQTQPSTGRITLEAGDTTKPTDPIDQGDGSGTTGQKGDLTIDNITALDFGSVKLTGDGQTIDNTVVNPNVQVTDKRGTGAGWKLMVKSSTFADATDATHTLKGATIDFPMGTVKTNAKDTANNTAMPTANKLTVPADGTSSDQVVMQADKDKGLGTWEDAFEQNTDSNKKVALNVAGGAYAGAYSATLTWTLTNTPTN